jgi:two-component system response regulator HydG
VVDLPSNLLYFVGQPRHDARALATLQELEQRAIVQALQATKGDRLRAARLLGIGKTTIYRKLKEYGLEDVADSPPS